MNLDQKKRERKKESKKAKKQKSKKVKMQKSKKKESVGQIKEKLHKRAFPYPLYLAVLLWVFCTGDHQGRCFINVMNRLQTIHSGWLRMCKTLFAFFTAIKPSD